jgi:hypothetical protein
MHYYRIRSVNENGEVLYSSIVKVSVNTQRSAIVVYPNPVVDGRIQIKFINQPKGNYVLKLIDNLGRVIITEEKYFSVRNEEKTLEAGKNIADGTYRLEVISPFNKVTSINIILQ